MNIWNKNKLQNKNANQDQMIEERSNQTSFFQAFNMKKENSIPKTHNQSTYNKFRDNNSQINHNNNWKSNQNPSSTTYPTNIPNKPSIWNSDQIIERRNPIQRPNHPQNDNSIEIERNSSNNSRSIWNKGDFQNSQNHDRMDQDQFQREFPPNYRNKPNSNNLQTERKGQIFNPNNRNKSNLNSNPMQIEEETFDSTLPKKTNRPCKYFQEGHCKKGNDCTFSHETQDLEVQEAESLFKKSREKSKIENFNIDDENEYEPSRKLSIPLQSHMKKQEFNKNKGQSNKNITPFNQNFREIGNRAQNARKTEGFRNVEKKMISGKMRSDGFDVEDLDQENNNNEDYDNNNQEDSFEDEETDIGNNQYSKKQIKNEVYKKENKKREPIKSRLLIKKAIPKTKSKVNNIAEKIVIKNEKLVDLKEMKRRLIEKQKKKLIENSPVRENVSDSPENDKNNDNENDNDIDNDIEQEENETKFIEKRVFNNETEMCIETERTIRESGGQLDIFEIDPSSYKNGKFINKYPKSKPEWCMKKFARSDAGREKDEPFTYEKLSYMLDYLVEEIIDVDNKKNVPYLKKPGTKSHTFYDIYDFVYDRFRAINKDLTMLNNNTEKANIQILEQMIRFLILSINECRGGPSFSVRRNMERITDFLTTLIDSYQEARKKGDKSYRSPNEAEFFAYNLIFLVDAPLNLNRHLANLSENQYESIMNSKEISFMLESISAILEVNITKYFLCLNKANYLEACCLSYYLNTIRKNAFDQICKMVPKEGKLKDYRISLSFLLKLLYFNDYKELLLYLASYGLDISHINIEDNYLDETQIQNSFIYDWNIEYNPNYVINFADVEEIKNKKIDEKKSKNKFIESDNINYHNNKDVSRQFLVKGKWKNKIQPYANKIVQENSIIEKNEESHLKKQKTLVNNNFISPILNKKLSANNINDNLEIHSIHKKDVIEIIKPSFIPTLKIKENEFKVENKVNNNNNTDNNFITIKKQISEIKPIISTQIIIPEKVPKIKKKIFKLRKICQILKKNRVNIMKKFKNKQNILNIFYNSLEPGINQFYDNSCLEKMNNIDSENDWNKTLIDFLGYNLCNERPSSEVNFSFKISIISNNQNQTLNNLSITILRYFTNEKNKYKPKKIFKNISQIKHGGINKQLEYCCRYTNKISRSTPFLGSNCIIYILSDDYEQNLKQFKKFIKLMKKKTEGISLIFIAIENKSNKSEKENFFKFLHSDKFKFIRNIHLYNVPLEKKKKNYSIKEIKKSLWMINMEQKIFNFMDESIKSIKYIEKTKTIHISDIFSDILYIINDISDQDFKNLLKEKTLKSYFFNKNLINCCLSQILNSFKTQLNNRYQLITEFYTKSEKEIRNNIFLNQKQIIRIINKAFMDKMDAYYRSNIKDNLYHNLDFSLLIQLIFKYFEGFYIFKDEFIENFALKSTDELNDKFSFSNYRGIEGDWNYFFCNLLKKLYFSLSETNLNILLEENFQFKIDLDKLIEITNTEIEDHMKWIEEIKKNKHYYKIDNNLENNIIIRIKHNEEINNISDNEKINFIDNEESKSNYDLEKILKEIDSDYENLKMRYQKYEF